MVDCVGAKVSVIRRSHIFGLIKRLWLVLIFAAILLYLSQNYQTLRDQLATYAPPTLLASTLLLLAGRIVLTETSRYSVLIFGVSMSYRRAFYITSISLLAKYLPGGIWHFVGRAGYYRADGLPVALSTRIIILENVWLVTSAALFGAILLVESVGLAFVVVVCWIGLLWLVTRQFDTQITSRMFLRYIALQAVQWTLFGLSFAVLRSPDGALLRDMGAFCLSFAIGYVTVFAPSGIGVREAVMVILLTSSGNTDAIVIVAAVHRFIWTLTELIMGGTARLFAAPQAQLETAPLEVRDDAQMA